MSGNVYFLMPITVKNASEMSSAEVVRCTQLKAGHPRPASETPFKWRFAGEPMMVQHLMLAWLAALWFLEDPDQYC